MAQSMKKAVVLSSSGSDSPTAMAMAVGYEIYCLGFTYCRRHAWGRILGLFYDIIYELGDVVSELTCKKDGLPRGVGGGVSTSAVMRAAHFEDLPEIQKYV